jgi:predicted permease
MEYGDENLMDTFLFALNAIFPIVLLIMLGYFAKRIKFFDFVFYTNLNKYVFRIGLPTLMFFNILQMDSLKDIPWSIILFVVIALFVVFLLSVPLVKLLIKNNSEKGVVLQAAIHTNALLVGVPLMQTLGNPGSIVILSISRAFSLPFIIMLCVISLSMFQKDMVGQKMSVSKLVKNVLKNPLIIAVFLALFSLFLRGFIPQVNGQRVFVLERDVKFMYDTIRMISQTASPMALIALGGQFEFKAISAQFKQITIGVFLRIVFVPSIVLTAAYLLKDRITDMHLAFAPMIALYATPIAVASVFMAEEMHSDTKLASQLVVWSAIFSIFTLYIIITTFRFLGVL